MQEIVFISYILTLSPNSKWNWQRNENRKKKGGGTYYHGVAPLWRRYTVYHHGKVLSRLLINIQYCYRKMIQLFSRLIFTSYVSIQVCRSHRI